MEITWEKFCTQIIKTSKDKMFPRVSMHDAFNRPKYSKTGFPKIQKCKSLDKLNRGLIGKNIAELIVYELYNKRHYISIRTITPIEGGICIVRVETLNELIECIGVDNIIKIYKYMLAL